MSTTETREDLLLDSVLPRYIADGFTVIRRPSSSVLPAFMGKYRPDAIALSTNKKIAIEINRDIPSREAAFNSISRVFEQQPNWELRVYYLPESAQERILPPPTQQTVENTITEIDNLKASGIWSPR